MKGLLYKEFLSLKKYLNALGLLLVLYFGISVYSREVSFFAGFSAMAAVIVTFSAFTYDNYANWDRYALSLPLSRKNLVQGRYLFALIIVAVPYPQFSLRRYHPAFQPRAHFPADIQLVGRSGR